MTIKSNPNAWVTAWKQGVSTKAANYVTGVNNSADWAANATAPGAVQARNAGLSRAIADGTIDAGIQRKGTQGWRQATAAKAQNWQTGVNSPAAQQNALNGANVLFGFLNNAVQAADAIPRGDYNTNKQRLNAYLDSMHEQAQTRRGY